MLKAWWWKWSLLDSSGPMRLAQTTEPTASKIITSSLLERKDNSQKERGGESEECEWITNTMSSYV